VYLNTKFTGSWWVVFGGQNAQKQLINIGHHFHNAVNILLTRLSQLFGVGFIKWCTVVYHWRRWSKLWIMETVSKVSKLLTLAMQASTVMKAAGVNEENLNVSLHFAWAALKFCLPWASLNVLFYLAETQLARDLAHWASGNEKLLVWQENLLVLGDWMGLFLSP